MTGPGRYLRLFAAFARFGLANELSFRANFLVKIFVEVLWLSILLGFYLTIFQYTGAIEGWTREEYLFFIGCHYALGGLIDTFCLENCMEFAELVRSGDLDFYLLKPIEEQFLITCRKMDWSTAPNILLGAGIMGGTAYALAGQGWHFGPLHIAAFIVLFFCGTALAYSFLLLLTASSVWLVRNQNLMEMWWLFTNLMRYPREIYRGPWGAPFGWVFSFVVPVILVVNVPAHVMKESLFDWKFISVLVVATPVLLFLSRRFFFHALQSYRSASS